jgi:stress response protein YsnF
MKGHLSNEEIDVTKEPYVKEGVAAKKKFNTKTITAADSTTSEKFMLQLSKKKNY